METDKKSTDTRKTPLGIEKRFDRFGDWLDDSWALRKASPMLSRFPKSIAVLTWLMRIAVGCVFIISGFSKGIDPWGTYYKANEYLIAMHIPLQDWGNTVLALVFILFSLEFLIGVWLITGCFRKATPILCALFMIVMLPLTLWIAISDPVADCGCFGDLFVVSNWATFFKNCLISLATVWLIKFNSKVRCIISPYLQWIATLAASAYIMAVGYIGYWQQPAIDFRPYKIGTQLLAGDEGAEYDPVFSFVYEKEGREIRIGEDDEIPDEREGWKFVRREEEGFRKNQNVRLAAQTAGDADFRIWNETGDEDVTDLLSGYDSQLILLVPDISSLSMATSWKINALYDLAKKNNTEFFAVVAGSPDDIEEWRDLSSGQYPIYTADDTSIKTLARGNPALVSLEDGVIKWKSALSALNLEDGAVVLTDGETVILKNLTFFLLAVLGVLILASMLGRSSIASFFSGGVNAEKNKEKNGEAPQS